MKAEGSESSGERSYLPLRIAIARQLFGSITDPETWANLVMMVVYQSMARGMQGPDICVSSGRGGVDERWRTGREGGSSLQQSAQTRLRDQIVVVQARIKRCRIYHPTQPSLASVCSHTERCIQWAISPISNGFLPTPSSATGLPTTPSSFLNP